MIPAAPKNRRTVIGGYTVELDFTIERNEIISSCMVTKIVKGVGYVASLDFLENERVLTGYFNGDEHDVPASTIKRISQWAYANEY